MKSQYKVYREASLFYFSIPFLWFSLFFSIISQPPGWNQQIGNHPYPCPPTWYLQWYIFPRFFKLVRVLSLSRMLVEFFLSLTCMFHHVWEKFFNLVVFTFLENALNLWFIAHAPVPKSKFQVEFFENLFLPRRKEWRKLWFALLNSARKYQDDLEH